MGYIYFVQIVSSGNIKIGYSSNVKARIHTLQTSIPEKLKLLGFVSGTITKEKELHNLFKRFAIRGEWFEYNDDIINYLNENNEMTLKNGLKVFLNVDENKKIWVLGKMGS